MAALSSPACVDLFVGFSPFREVIPELHLLLRPLRPLERFLIGVEGYTAAGADSALVNLRLERDAAELLGLDQIVALIAGLGLTVVAPENLAADDQEFFYLRHLAAYDTYVQLYAEDECDGLIDRLVDALAEHVALPRERVAQFQRAPTYL